jgi:hypothetical protein
VNVVQDQRHLVAEPAARTGTIEINPRVGAVG